MKKNVTHRGSGARDAMPGDPGWCGRAKVGEKDRERVNQFCDPTRSSFGRLVVEILPAPDLSLRLSPDRTNPGLRALGVPGRRNLDV